MWTSENLRTTRFNDSTKIQLMTDSVQWRGNDSYGNFPAYCFYNNKTNIASIKKYGALYNWYAVDTKKLAPVGWHIPTEADWDSLEKYLIANGYNWDSTKANNKIAKSMATTTDWLFDTTNGSIGFNISKNNASGFSGLPGGGRFNSARFLYADSCGIWWSSTKNWTLGTCYFVLRYDMELSFKNYGSDVCGFSVRIVRDN